MNLAWIKPKDASLAELAQQLEGARGAHEEACAAVAAAQEAFDIDPGKQRALFDAQDAQRETEAHLGRAQRLLASAEAAARAEERAQLERRASELREQLSPSGRQKLRARVLNAEVKALKLAIEARVKAQEVEEHIGQLDHELKQIRVQLGEPAEEVFSVSSLHLGPTRAPTDDVVAGLADAFKDLGVDDKHRRYARAMTSYLRNV